MVNPFLKNGCFISRLFYTVIYTGRACSYPSSHWCKLSNLSYQKNEIKLTTLHFFLTLAFSVLWGRVTHCELASKFGNCQGIMDSLHAKRRSILKEFRLKINLVPPLTSLYAGSLGKFLELVLDKSLENKETSWRDFCKRRQSWPEGGQNWLEEACPEIVVCTVFDSGIEWVDIIVDCSSYTGLFPVLVNFFLLCLLSVFMVF